MPLTSEQEITATVNRILADWIAVEHQRAWPTPAELEFYREAYRDFAQWAESYGLRLPVSGHAVAGYLLELASDGVPAADLARMADAIAFYYSLNRTYLDGEPISAALALVAAQMSPDRTLN
jgi:hypothetical protein